MRKIILSLILAIAVLPLAYTQKVTTITGNVKSLSDGTTVILQDWASYSARGSESQLPKAEVKNGKFA